MGTLWTPSGEHQPADEPPHAAGDAADPTGTERAPTAEEVAALRRMHAELRAVPVEDVVANHALGLVQLAVVHLGLVTPPDDDGRVPAPDLVKAGVAVDAVAALVDGLGARLGEHEGVLREALSQVQTAYVQVSDALDRAGRDPG